MPSKNFVTISFKVKKDLLQVIEKIDLNGNSRSSLFRQAFLIGLLVLKARDVAFPSEFTKALEFMISKDDSINSLIDEAYKFGEAIKKEVKNFLDALFGVPNYHAFSLFGKDYARLSEKYGGVD